ncbi:M949_RS01915 family surface polysaccharide biosynthesis protein [Mucilaginibacter sp.]|uniref:M949_RS01915 family surface polysaccharide biosynthesis protein n=1 Tax=Mucilaginibacter sp. TaxID=1882438 RepID=UPI0028521545|nr:hypothetical protein [Mucilaginibacter sp.]MDR3697972.1 hypothetical protein [Mucilaginibacter sp.]
MKLTKLVFLLFISPGIYAQVKVVQLNKNALPPSIKYKGNIITIAEYTDTTGEHLIITTETGIKPSKNSPDSTYRDAALYAYHYDISGKMYKLSWQTYDFVEQCPVDLTASYIPDTFAITDLNKDGKAEVWLMYKTVCHGDVSPGEMKIIMHEGNRKYAMRGTNRVNIADNKYDGGEYAFDDTFKTGPKTFRDYAQQLWKKNMFYDK